MFRGILCLRFLKKLHKFANTYRNLKKIISDVYYCISYVAICINLQLPIVISKKSSISDMHHRERYMYINFQQNRASRSVKTVHTNLFAKFLNCISLHLAIRILKNHAFQTYTSHYPLTYHQADSEIHLLVIYQNTAKKNISTDDSNR